MSNTEPRRWQKHCRCCGKEITGLLELADGYPIHTRCIAKHWRKHVYGKNASRCQEFGKR